jgi:cytochrome oxidase Cu insertion factor (SCO1/SenC/PrrC family)|tara:strand:+ start:249 stop:461 length:213 start_codon:yes stop_codon:yes gene_type:complete
MRLLVVVCLAGACGGTEVVAPPTTAPPTATAPSSVVPEVLDFTATLSDGTTFVGADLAGRDVLFWFWAPS